MRVTSPMRALPAILALALAACGRAGVPFPPASPVPAPPVPGALRLRDGVVGLVVEPEGEWARFQDDHARRFLAAAEGYLDVSLGRGAAAMFHGMPEPWSIHVQGRSTVFVGALHIGAYNNLSGWAGPERGIFMELRLARGSDAALVLHELSHFWFKDPGAALLDRSGPPHGIPWFNEGVASALPLAVAEAGLFALTPDEERAIGDHWGKGRITPPEVDGPVERDLRHEGKIGPFYAKTFKVQLIVHHELGAVGYRAFLTRAAKAPPRSAADVLALLAASKPLDWRAALTGWVFDGPYADGYSPADVAKL